MHLLLDKLLPVKVTKPHMLLHLVGPVEAYPVRGLPLDQLIDEVGSFHGPARREVALLQYHLFFKYLITYFFPILADVGPPAKHKLIKYDAQREIIDSYSVILAAHHFRSHVSRRTRCVLGVVRSPYSRYSHICDVQVTLLIQQ